MDSLITTQRWLYEGMASGLKTADSPSTLAWLLMTAVLFGAIHALMPGHGKIALISYHLARPGRALDGLATGTLLVLSHVGSAILLVLAGVIVISRVFAAAGRTPAIEMISAGLIVLVGLWLLVQAVRHRDHGTARDGRALAVVTGLAPCPLTTFVMVYASARNAIGLGLAISLSMAAGMILTIAGIAVATVLARSRLMRLLAKSGAWRQQVGRTLEIGGSMAVLAFGLWLLVPRLIG
jgi:ABC-type nickel/cobalt efflux system permease component RcnA